MDIPTCVDFWTWIAAGFFIVPLLQWLKSLPTIGSVVAEWAWLLAPILSALAPAIAEAVTPYCAVIDPVLWIAIYAGVTYLVSQLVYWVSRKATLIH